MKRFAKGSKKKSGRRKGGGAVPDVSDGFDDLHSDIVHSDSRTSHSGDHTMRGHSEIPEELAHQIDALEVENQTLKELIRAHDEGSGYNTSEIVKELAAVREERDDLQKEIDELEQENEDMRRNHQVEVDKLKEEIMRLESNRTTYRDSSDQSQEYRMRIDELERQLEEAQRSASQQLETPASSAAQGNAETQKELNNARFKIQSLDEEVQDLLQRNLDMEVELADMRLKQMGEYRVTEPRYETPVGVGFTDFEAERKINDLKAQITSKNQEIHILKERIETLNIEIGDLQKKNTTLAAVYDETAAVKTEKRKKRWFGGTSKRTKKLEAIEAAKVDAARTHTDISAAPSDMSDDSASSQDFVSTPKRRVRMAAPDAEKVAKDRKRLLELERENSRLEGALDISKREKDAIEDKVKRLDAQIEVFKSKQLGMSGMTTNLIGVPKSIGIVPPEGGTELDKLRLIVQIQEAALQKVSIEKEQARDVLAGYAKSHENVDHKLAVKEKEHKEEVTTLRKECAMWMQKRRAYEDELALTKGKLSMAEIDGDKLRRSLTALTTRHKSMAMRVDAKTDIFSLMLGQSLKKNDDLLTDLTSLKTKHLKDVSAYQGEVRTLRDGRVRRLDGDLPSKVVFPSPIFNFAERGDFNYESPLHDLKTPGQLHSPEPIHYAEIPGVRPALSPFASPPVSPPVQRSVAVGEKHSVETIPRKMSVISQDSVFTSESSSDSKTNKNYKYQWSENQGYVLTCKNNEGDRAIFSTFVDQPRIRPTVKVSTNAAGASHFPPSAGMFKHRTPEPPPSPQNDLPSDEQSADVPLNDKLEVPERDKVFARDLLRSWNATLANTSPQNTTPNAENAQRNVGPLDAAARQRVTEISIRQNAAAVEKQRQQAARAAAAAERVKSREVIEMPVTVHPPPREPIVDIEPITTPMILFPPSSSGSRSRTSSSMSRPAGGASSGRSSGRLLPPEANGSPLAAVVEESDFGSSRVSSTTVANETPLTPRLSTAGSWTVSEDRIRTSSPSLPYGDQYSSRQSSSSSSSSSSRSNDDYDPPIATRDFVGRNSDQSAATMDDFGSSARTTGRTTLRTNGGANTALLDNLNQLLEDPPNKDRADMFEPGRGVRDELSFDML